MFLRRLEHVYSHRHGGVEDRQVSTPLLIVWLPRQRIFSNVTQTILRRAQEDKARRDKTLMFTISPLSHFTAEGEYPCVVCFSSAGTYLVPGTPSDLINGRGGPEGECTSRPKKRESLTCLFDVPSPFVRLCAVYVTLSRSWQRH